MPNKGRNGYAIKVGAGMIDGLGHKRVVLKADQEPAIKTLKEGIQGEATT